MPKHRTGLKRPHLLPSRSQTTSSLVLGSQPQLRPPALGSQPGELSTVSLAWLACLLCTACSSHWDLWLLQCDLFIQEGARLGRTPAEVVSTCDITFACVSDPKAAKDVRIPSLPSASQVVARKAGWPPPLLPCTRSECLHVGVGVDFPIWVAISHCEGCLHALNTDFL